MGDTESDSYVQTEEELFESEEDTEGTKVEEEKEFDEGFDGMERDIFHKEDNIIGDSLNLTKKKDVYYPKKKRWFLTLLKNEMWRKSRHKSKMNLIS